MFVLVFWKSFSSSILLNTFGVCAMVLCLVAVLVVFEISLPRTMPWICVGDHNDIPSEHVLLQDNPIPGLIAVYPQDADNIPLPTRWEGTRCIDYFMTNNHERIRCVSFFDDAVSDHKIVTATILSSLGTKPWWGRS